MKILLNCLSSRSGGANAYIMNILAPLADALAAQRAELIVLGRKDQRPLLGSIPEGQCILIDSRDLASPRRLFWEVRHLHQIAAETGAAVTFTPYQVGILARGTANVTMLRNMEPFFSGQYRYTARSRLRNALLRQLSSRFLMHSDAVIAVSDFALGYARDILRIDAARLTRIYHGRDTSIGSGDPVDDAAVVAGLGVTSPYIFSCGSVLPYRRFEDVISAFEILASAHDNGPSLVLAGSGTDASYRRRLLAQIDRSPARGLIHFLGQVAFESMGALYRQARLFVTSTEVEACPNIAIEAMTAGCTILSANVPVLQEMFADAADFYPNRDAAALATLLRQHLIDEGSRSSWSLRARTRAEQFSWKETGKSTAALLVAAG